MNLYKTITYRMVRLCVVNCCVRSWFDLLGYTYVILCLYLINFIASVQYSNRLKQWAWNSFNIRIKTNSFNDSVYICISKSSIRTSSFFVNYAVKLFVNSHSESFYKPYIYVLFKAIFLNWNSFYSWKNWKIKHVCITDC